MKTRKKVLIAALLVLGMIILFNYLANQFFFRLDFTADKRFTLSQATKNILKDLKEPVTITAYFSDNLPPQLDQVKRDFRDMLVEYASRSKGMINYDFVNPLKDNKLKAQAQKDGVNQIQIQVQQKDQVQAQIAYMGASVHMGEQSEALPIIQAMSGLEYKLSSAIKKLSVTNKPVVGLVQGHGEVNFGKIWQAKQQLDVLYNTELVKLDSSFKPAKYKTLAIIDPTDTIPPDQLAKLDGFIKGGGRLLIAISRAGANLTKEQYSHSITTGLAAWLVKKGIHVNNNMVTDIKCQQGFIQPQPGYFMQITLPYFPILTHFGKHPVSSGLEQVNMQFASSIDYTGDSTVKYTPLVMTSDHSGTLPAAGYLNITQKWTESDFPLSGLTVAAALQGKIDNTQTKMVVIGNGTFATPDPNSRQKQVSADNVNLLVNAIDWLSDDTGLVELRTKGVTARPIKDLDDSKRAFLKYLNFFLPVLLVLIYGIIRFQQKRIKRLKRMEEGYVQ